MNDIEIWFLIVFVMVVYTALTMFILHLIDKYKSYSDKWWFGILIFFFVILTPPLYFLQRNK